jgi:hypothetical protein
MHDNYFIDMFYSYSPAGPSCSTPNGPTMHSYMASEHQAGFVSGVGGFSVGKTMGQ